MNDKKALNEIQKDKIISLTKEYVENRKCSCGPSCCWRCLFEYNLNLLESERPCNQVVEAGQAKPFIVGCPCTAIKTGQCGEWCNQYPPAT